MNATVPRGWSLLLSLGLVVACGGGDGGGGGSAGADIGPAGGTVSGPNGAQVVIPAGALAATVRVGVAQSSAGAPSVPGGTLAVGQVYAFTPHGTAFAVPVTISVPFDTSAAAGLTPALLKTNGAGQWEEVAATVSGNTLTAAVTGFSWALVIGRGSSVHVDASTDAPRPANEAVGPLTFTSLTGTPTDLGGQAGIVLDGAGFTATERPMTLQVTVNTVTSQVVNVTFSWLSGETMAIAYCVTGSPGMDCNGVGATVSGGSGAVTFAATHLTFAGSAATSATLTGRLEYSGAARTQR
jgi:hypothetical protein